MDSGNSGSFQSSSGEEEFDSQADGISALMSNPPAAAHVIGPNSNQQPPPPPPSQPPPSRNTNYMYDHPLSNYFEPVSRPRPPAAPPQLLQNPTSSLLNSDVDWSKTLRSEEISPMLPSSSSLQSLLAAQNQVQHHGSAENTTETTQVLPSEPRVGARNPRKRSRASRRAPTTVLTTDTTNFRAMVQEFTGIPAPPFTSVPFQRSRLDLFGTASSMRFMDPSSQPPPYLRRPFPQKVQLPPPPSFLASSSSLLGTSGIIGHAIASSNTNNMTLGVDINSTTPIPLTSSLSNYQFPPQASSLFNLPNPFVSSFLDPNTVKFPPTTKSLQESLDFPSNDEFGGQVNTNTLSGLPGLISSDQTTPRNNDQAGVNWGNDGVGSSQDDDQSPVIRSAANGNFSFSS